MQRKCKVTVCPNTPAADVQVNLHTSQFENMYASHLKYTCASHTGSWVIKKFVALKMT